MDIHCLLGHVLEALSPMAALPAVQSQKSKYLNIPCYGSPSKNTPQSGGGLSWLPFGKGINFQLFPSNQGLTPSFWFHSSFKLIPQVTGWLSKLSSSSTSLMLHQIQNQLWSWPPPGCLPTAESSGEQPVPQKSGAASAPSAPRLELPRATPASFPLWFVSLSQWRLQRTVRCAEQGKGQLALPVTSQGSSKPQLLWCSALLQLTPNCNVAFWSIYNSVFWFNFSLKRGLILLGIYLLGVIEDTFHYWHEWLCTTACPQASPPMMLYSSSLHS